MKGRIAEQAKLVAAARGRDELLRFECYCDGEDCPVREVAIRVKDYDRDKRLAAGWAGLRCPVCSHVLKIHNLFDRKQWAADRDHAARGNITLQMWERDKGSPIPANILLSDRLPPSPPGWWDL